MPELTARTLTKSYLMRRYGLSRRQAVKTRRRMQAGASLAVALRALKETPSRRLQR